MFTANIGSKHIDVSNFNEQDRNYSLVPNWESYEDISVIQCGTAIYPLRNKIKAIPVFPLNDNKLFLFYADDLPDIYGKGKTVVEAKENWQYEFHKKFQNLSSKLDWERTEKETKLWEIFEEVVDIQAHREQTPVEFQQIGQIVENKNIPDDKREILWLDKSREIVDFAEGLSNYSEGQYFGARVLRDYKSGKLIKICSVIPTHYRDYTNEEIEEFTSMLKTSKELPVSTIWK